jgi:glutamine synthetase
LRLSIASAHNDHRLGANEAPPAIISIFLGDQLNSIVEQIEQGGAKSTKQGGLFETGVSVLPQLPKDAGDRNRTSPFAFTGNKFEFRAVGSSQNIAGPNTVLNTIVAESLDYIATKLEADVKSGKTLNAAVQALLPTIIKEHKRVVFNGDNYSEQWHKEAEKRGLPNLKNTVDCLPVVLKKETVELFKKYRVYTEKELASRYNILAENYAKTVNIEGQLMLYLARTMILPACVRYQGEVATSVNATKAAGVDHSSQLEYLKTLAATISDFQHATTKLDKALHQHADGDAFAHARHMRDAVLAPMAELRKLGDTLETMVADDHWPLPTYREILFIK